ncbi:EamA family transporter [Octadecabacter sp. G9-8]|uniref:EamA family transporter n=1 Tax=Octadecabacter dasysiphoniae TaxID=2909341 RepID=A0ABS9CWH8_9RHOB|nr:EamA family transporter [Octadecabacter dasysiphoniae]MCF2870511.1 EamA family transporter [Octadecabacter dasysiphoniae]
MTPRDTLLIILTTLIWGFNFVVIKWGVADVSAPMMTALRFALVAIPLVFFVKKPNVPLPAVAAYGLLFGCGIWGVVNFAISVGTPAGQASLLLQSSAFMTAIAGVVFFSETMSAQKTVGILFAFMGFLLISSGALTTNSLLGVGLVFVAGLAWTVCNVIVRYYKPDNILSFIVWSSLFVPLPILGYLALFTSDLTGILDISGWRGITSIVFQAVVTTIFGYGIWTKMITKYGLSAVAPYSLIVPISGLIFASLFFGESLTLIEVLGSILVLLGLAFMSNLMQKKPI